jgi:hypothetical protein
LDWVAQHQHQRLMRRVAQVDGAVRLGQPQLHAARGQYVSDMNELVAVEGPLVLADHHGIERVLHIRGGSQQRGGPGPFRPWHAA